MPKYHMVFSVRGQVVIKMYNFLLQEAWYCKGAAGRPATGYLEEDLRYVRRKNIAMTKESPGASASQPRSLVKLPKAPTSGGTYS